MAKTVLATRIARAYAQDEKAEQRLVALGIPMAKIYRASKGQTLDKIRLRKGEFLGVLDGLRGLVAGSSKKEIVAAVDRVHEQGATVLDLETGLNSRADGVKMYHRAFAPKGPEPDVARAMQAKSAMAKRNGGMDYADAERIWDDPRYRTLAHALEAMGWAQATAYFYFGKRFSLATRPNRFWAEKKT